MTTDREVREDRSEASAPAPAPTRRWHAPGSTTQIVIGLLAGVATGLFIGERARALQPAADIYIRLMQMTVLPYLVVILIGGVGRLDARGVRYMGLRATALLALLIGAGLAIVAVMPWTFPSIEAATFYSDTLIAPHEPLALGEIFVPANPFHAMANAVVPGVVLFSLALGLALIGVPDKDALLGTLRALEAAVVRVTRFVVSLTPIGVFAIVAVLAGTMDAVLLRQLEVYLVAFAAGALLLGFVVLPLIASALTPFSYRSILHMGKGAMLTAFLTSSAFIVLPMLVEQVKAALAERGLASRAANSSVDIVVPLSFVIPNAGKLLTLLFVPYATWMSGVPMEIEGYLKLFAAGLPTYFAKAQVALPFLMDLVDAPQDLFQLYIPSAVVTGKFDSMVTVMSLLALALLTAAVAGGHLSVSWSRIGPRAALAVAVTVATVVGVRLLLGATVDMNYEKDDQLRNMHLSRATLPMTLLAEPPAVAAVPGEALRQIRARRSLRVGYVPDRLPLSFVNAHGQLVGMDIELANRLAEALGVERVEFHAAGFYELASLLAQGRVDVAVGMAIVVEGLSTLAYSSPYLDSSIGLVVRDRDRHAFATVDGVRARGKVTIGITVDSASYRAMISAALPGVAVTFVKLASPRDFLEGRAPGVDALAQLAESGAAWAVLYPAYSIVVPQPHRVGVPVALAMRHRDHELAKFIEDWLVIQRSAGNLDELRQYWILGRGAATPRRRWSVMDDVLGWGRAAGEPGR